LNLQTQCLGDPVAFGSECFGALLHFAAGKLVEIGIDAVPRSFLLGRIGRVRNNTGLGYTGYTVRKKMASASVWKSVASWGGLVSNNGMI